MSLRSLLKRLIVEEVGECKKCGKRKPSMLNEVDWSQFGDVSAKKMSIEQTKEYLKKVVGNCGEGEKLSPDKPYIHAKRIPQTAEGDIDIKEFIRNITQMPNEIISKNQKMVKSEGEDSISLNIGIPALRGLLFDTDSNEFYIVNTCPGAGSCALICYARRGSYVMFPDVFVKQTRVLNLLMNKPEMFQRMLSHEIEGIAMKYPDKQIDFRWNDAGDFFTRKYFNIATEITRDLQKKGYKIKSYAYTKMGDIMNLQDPSVVLNFSDDANKRETSKIQDLAKTKTSKIVAKELFDDLFAKDKRNYVTDEKGKIVFKSPAAEQELKNRIAKKFGVDVNTLLTYTEYVQRLMTKGKGQPNQFNVIVMPKGDGDITARNTDVQTTFLLFH
jgi:hypothetical protein